MITTQTTLPAGGRHSRMSAHVLSQLRWRPDRRAVVGPLRRDWGAWEMATISGPARRREAGAPTWSGFGSASSGPVTSSALRMPVGPPVPRGRRGQRRRRGQPQITRPRPGPIRGTYTSSPSARTCPQRLEITTALAATGVGTASFHKPSVLRGGRRPDLGLAVDRRKGILIRAGQHTISSSSMLQVCERG